MSIYSNVTQNDLDNLRKLADQQKPERALKIKNGILKQTHDVKLAESLSPVTKKLNELNKSTQESLTPKNENIQKVGDIIKESNEIIPSDQLKDTFESLENTNTSLKLGQNEDGDYKILDTIIKPIGHNKILVNNNIYKLTPEIHKALSKPSYTGKSMKDINDRETLYNFLKDIGYNGRFDS